MRMTSEQVKAIQDSFAKVAPISEQAAEIFYGRLFEIALERGLGEHWTPDVAAAWTAAYTVLSEFMIGEAYDHRIAA